jgi:sensor histidine kinase YesM
MTAYPFIFSNEKKYRFRRHFYFWLFWWLFQGFLYSFVAAEKIGDYFTRLPMSMIESFLYLASHIFLAYFLIYFVVPRYLLKQRYWAAGLLCLAGFLLAALLAAATSIFIIHPLRAALFPEYYPVPFQTSGVRLFLALMAGLRGGITIGGLAAAIKLMKTLYLKEQRNLQLQKQNVEAQLKILQAQVHPHFLFNTLNNIYSESQEKAPKAARLVGGLSELLRFILYESNKTHVLLQTELKLIRDYISLEQIRYGNNLEIHIDMPEETGNLVIAPLLLLPLVENCFKHGSSQLIEQPWINLKLELNKEQMHLKLMNGKPLHTQPAADASGIGIANVRKRLELLYPDQHTLVVHDEGEVFVVNLKLRLQYASTLQEQKTDENAYHD